MNRSIAFAATSISAILLVAATLSTAASAQEGRRNIDISKKKFPTISTINPGADTQEAEILPTSGKRQNRISTIDPGQDVSTIDPGQEVGNGGLQKASTEPQVLFKSTIEPGVNVDQGGDFQDARADVPDEPRVNPKQFTIDPSQDTSEEASAPEIDNSDEQFADAEIAPTPKPPKKLPKVLQDVEETEDTDETAEAPKPIVKPLLKPKKPVDAATSDDVEDEEEVVTKEVEEKPPVEAAEVEEEEVAPTINKKLRMHYSPALRRYVQTTDEDMGYEAAEYQDDSYEVPTYRRSYVHGYGQRYSHSYLPSCEN